MNERDGARPPQCPLCDERANYEGWDSIGRAFCRNGECPIEEWDPDVEWIEFDCSDCGKHVSRPPHQMDVPGLTPERCSSCTLEAMAQQ